MQSSQESGNKASGPKSPHDLVRHIDSLAWQATGGARWACAFGAAEGTKKMALYAGELEPGRAHRLDAGESEAVGYLLAGRGTVSIGGRDFGVKAGDGFHVRAGEALSVHPSPRAPFNLLMVVCPSHGHAPWETEFRGFRPPPRTFDSAYPERVVSPGEAESEATGDRRFKVMVGPRTGSATVTQFIGSIPRSKAPEHYHHYEEVICILSGEGRMWIGDDSTPVRPGSLIFLPREQLHCLECTVDEGMELLGMFYPAGSPAVNYAPEDVR